MLDYIVMQMRKTNREKGYCTSLETFCWPQRHSYSTFGSILDTYSSLPQYTFVTYLTAAVIIAVPLVVWIVSIGNVVAST